jgi:hypothetical protein
MGEDRRELDRFCQLVLENERLHDQLCATADLESFVALAVELARQHGCNFTAAQIHELLKEKRRAWLERWV